MGEEVGRGRLRFRIPDPKCISEAAGQGNWTKARRHSGNAGQPRLQGWQCQKDGASVDEQTEATVGESWQTGGGARPAFAFPVRAGRCREGPPFSARRGAGWMAPWWRGRSCRSRSASHSPAAHHSPATCLSHAHGQKQPCRGPYEGPLRRPGGASALPQSSPFPSPTLPANDQNQSAGQNPLHVRVSSENLSSLRGAFQGLLHLISQSGPTRPNSHHNPGLPASTHQFRFILRLGFPTSASKALK